MNGIQEFSVLTNVKKSGKILIKLMEKRLDYDKNKTYKKSNL